MLSHWKHKKDIVDWVSQKKAVAKSINENPNLAFDIKDVLGFGQFGVVFQCQDPSLVLKVTDSEEEYQLAKFLKHNPMPGFPLIKNVQRFLDGVYHVTLIWRGKCDIVGKGALDHTGADADAVRDVCQQYEKSALVDPEPAIAEIAKIPQLSTLAKSISELSSLGYCISDLKIQNLGCNHGDSELILFDAMLSDTSYIDETEQDWQSDFNEEDMDEFEGLDFSEPDFGEFGFDEFEGDWDD